MNDETPIAPLQAIYLLKVLAGLIAVCMVILAAFWLPLSGTSLAQQRWLIAVLAVLTLALVPAVHWVYRRSDELQRLQHQHACVSSLAVVASVSGLIGILQANQLIPLFNQFWTLGLLLALWGVGLMRADRRFK